MTDGKFSSLLRIPFSFTEKSRAEKLLAALDGGAFDSAMFFNTPTHDLVCEEKHRENAELLRPMTEAVAKKGISVGINVLSTVGHHLESPDPALDAMDFQQDASGWTNRGVYCPSSEKNLRAIAAQYRVYAGLNVDFIYIDDDMDYHCECYCPICLNEFESLYKDFSSRGLDVSRENMMFLLNEAGESVRRSVRSNWLDYYAFRADRIYRTVERAVHEINPVIVLGMMPCVVGYNGCGQKKWADTLAPDGRLLVRPGGGVYTDLRPMAALGKAHNIGRELRFVPEYAAVQSEIENFPQQSLRKSARFTAFEAMLYLCAGSTGTSYNVLSPSPDAAEEAGRFFAAAKKIRPFAEKFAAVFGRSVSRGIGCYWDKETFALPPAAGLPALPFEDAFYAVGLPICYHPEKMCAFVMNGASSAGLTDERLQEILRGGVYMDGDALEILCRRGYGEAIGFEKGKNVERNAAEYQLEHFLNAGPGCVRDAHLEFSINGHSEFDKTGVASTIVPRSPEAQALSVLKRYDGTEIGISLGIFENASGGRICVSSYAPFSWWYSAAAVSQLKNIFLWLSKGTLPAYVSSPEKIALWPRDTASGQSAAVFANVSLDDLSALKIRIRSSASHAEYVTFDGEKTEETLLSAEQDEDGYALVTLPRLKPLSAGYIIMR